MENSPGAGGVVPQAVATACGDCSLYGTKRCCDVELIDCEYGELGYLCKVIFTNCRSVVCGFNVFTLGNISF
jgi:hypothetical protein